MKYEVYEHQLGQDDKFIKGNLTKEEAEKIVAENPQILTMVPSKINGS